MRTLAGVVRIAYAEQYVDTMNYFRAVYASGEKSLRVLDLTKEAIALNGGNYTVWHHRWELVLALGTDVAAELAYVEAMALDNPKNYQVWGGVQLTQRLTHSLKAPGFNPCAYNVMKSWFSKLEIFTNSTLHTHLRPPLRRGVEPHAAVHRAAW